MELSVICHSIATLNFFIVTLSNSKQRNSTIPMALSTHATAGSYSTCTRTHTPLISCGPHRLGSASGNRARLRGGTDQRAGADEALGGSIHKSAESSHESLFVRSEAELHLAQNAQAHTHQRKEEGQREAAAEDMGQHGGIVLV